MGWNLTIVRSRSGPDHRGFLAVVWNRSRANSSRLDRTVRPGRVMQSVVMRTSADSGRAAAARNIGAFGEDLAAAQSRHRRVPPSPFPAAWASMNWHIDSAIHEPSVANAHHVSDFDVVSRVHENVTPGIPTARGSRS